METGICIPFADVLGQPYLSVLLSEVSCSTECLSKELTCCGAALPNRSTIGLPGNLDSAQERGGQTLAQPSPVLLGLITAWTAFPGMQPFLLILRVLLNSSLVSQLLGDPLG